MWEVAGGGEGSEEAGREERAVQGELGWGGQPEGDQGMPRNGTGRMGLKIPPWPRELGA